MILMNPPYFHLALLAQVVCPVRHLVARIVLLPGAIRAPHLHPMILRTREEEEVDVVEDLVEGKVEVGDKGHILLLLRHLIRVIPVEVIQKTREKRMAGKSALISKSRSIDQSQNLQSPKGRIELKSLRVVTVVHLLALKLSSNETKIFHIHVPSRDQDLGQDHLRMIQIKQIVSPQTKLKLILIWKENHQGKGQDQFHHHLSLMMINLSIIVGPVGKIGEQKVFLVLHQGVNHTIDRGNKVTKSLRDIHNLMSNLAAVLDFSNVSN